MKVNHNVWLLSSVITLGALVSCNNINRDSEDVSTRAATLSADTLETMKLSEVGSLGQEETTAEPIATLVSDTVPGQTSTTPPTATTANQGDDTYTETEVVQIDTVATRIVYDIKRRTIEQVDTVGATKTYEIKKRVLKRTVMVDTLTETEDQEQTVTFQTGDFKVLNEKVETDSAVKIVDYQQEKQEAAQARSQSAPATTPASSTPQSSDSQNSGSQNSGSQNGGSQSNSSPNSDSKTTEPSSSSAQSPSEQPSTQPTPSQARTNADTSATSGSTPTVPNGTAKQDTTRQRSESGS